VVYSIDVLKNTIHGIDLRACLQTVINNVFVSESRTGCNENGQPFAAIYKHGIDSQQLSSPASLLACKINSPTDH